MMVIRPLFAAGFVTAFGAHSIAANLGAAAGPGHPSVHVGGAVGPLRRRRGAAQAGLRVAGRPDRAPPGAARRAARLRAASAGFVLAGDPAWLRVARFAQGAAAAAFSPAAGAMIARIAPDRRRGRAFGSYGAWKGLGYTLGPILGGVLIRTPRRISRARTNPLVPRRASEAGVSRPATRKNRPITNRVPVKATNPSTPTATGPKRGLLDRLVGPRTLCHARVTQHPVHRDDRGHQAGPEPVQVGASGQPLAGRWRPAARAASMLLVEHGPRVSRRRTAHQCRRTRG